MHQIACTFSKFVRRRHPGPPIGAGTQIRAPSPPKSCLLACYILCIRAPSPPKSCLLACYILCIRAPSSPKSCLLVCYILCLAYFPDVRSERHFSTSFFRMMTNNVTDVYFYHLHLLYLSLISYLTHCDDSSSLT